ncbi:MAG: acetoin dehydrogenase dihydrolipoyllysine-residue acetyltransferase subunit [Pseudomonadota bacterium]
MPKVDMDMASGKVMTWHVAEGGPIEKGAPLFDIETDKAAMEVEAEAPGFVHHRVAIGTEVDIGQPVAWLYADGEDVGAAPEVASVDMPKAAPVVAAETLDAPEVVTETTKTRATPSARRAARNGGLRVEDISGSGPRGRVQQSDVEALLKRAEPTAPASFSAQSGPLAVTRRPGAGPPLVMVHGFAADAMSWASLETHLAGRETIRIDLPCHGKSPLQPVRDFAGLAQDLRRAVDDLNLDAFDLVGHSLGGALALALADIRPRKLRQLTLLAPAGLGPEINGAAIAGLCNATRPESLAPWLKMLVAEETLITDAFARLAHNARTPEMRIAQSAMADVLFPDGTQAFDLRAALSRLDVPTRIVWGKADRILPWKHALSAPGSVALHLYDGIGHAPHLEAPDVIGAMLTKPV